MSRIITVFGATGNQGGSVIKHLLADSQLSRQFKIRAVTRDLAKPAAQALAKQGVSLVKADLNSRVSISEAIKGSDTVFLVTNYWESADPSVERTQGKTVADVAKDLGVSHLIFSSLLNVTETSGGKLKNVPHFDSKADVEKYIRSLGIPATFVLAGYFMSNYTTMLQKQDDGSYSLAYPVGRETRFPLFEPAEDTGKFVKVALKHPEAYRGKQVLMAADYYTVDRITSDFEEATGKRLNFLQVSAEQYKSFLPKAIADEMLENHLFVENPGYYNGASLKESLDALEDKPTTWKEYAKKTFA
ncbi:hypothetical protein PV08_03703 [Exophiala spinifera]|uniref:NmrA-like family domain-containing protein 1 n=1 Tax=Exophiala spinifera TaxID=91928 RepID=A0A0D2BKF7_9EURO|nr:uncharacterized protein PV08_03703 [Exophiala spinifera]KIW19408.1 hypothetical protein PV08_03703 [Exophiala spinifera]